MSLLNKFYRSSEDAHEFRYRFADLHLNNRCADGYRLNFGYLGSGREICYDVVAHEC